VKIHDCFSLECVFKKHGHRVLRLLQGEPPRLMDQDTTKVQSRRLAPLGLGAAAGEIFLQRLEMIEHRI
jgi:hypothetical protein